MPHRARNFLKTITSASLYNKFGIAFILMSLVPLIFILFIISSPSIENILKQHLPYLKFTVLLLFLLSLASFDLLRRSMLALKNFTQHAREIASGNYQKRVDIKEDDELGFLANSFNKITIELEDKIRKLESSKKLLQSVLEKVGTAVTSTRGIGDLLELVLQTLVEGMNASSGMIFFADESSHWLYPKVSFGPQKPGEKLLIHFDEGLLGMVARLKRPQAASNVNINSATAFECDKGLAKRSLIAAPMSYKDKVLGVILIADKKESDSFTSDDMVLLNNVSAQTAVAAENFQLNEDAESTYLETISALAMAVEAKDPYSKGHIERVADYVERLGRQMGLDEHMLKVLKSGAILHDVGKIGVRDEVLKKHGSLTPEEEKEMRQHVTIGVNIIKPIRSMSELCDLVKYHQELYSGAGYPEGLAGNKIPLTARILKVCDAFDAMTTDRAYRKGMSREDARKELLAKSGSEFDPKIVEEFLKIV